jgi:hypothetical protein
MALINPEVYMLAVPKKTEGKTKEIKIHLGFMAEEIASVLKPIINSRMGVDTSLTVQKEDESVLIISRGDIREDLFEQFISNFGIAHYSETASSITANPDKSITEKVAYEIGQYLEGADIPALSIPGVKFKMKDFMKEGKPNISVGRIGTGPVTKICIQLPEMGYQSDMAAVYTMGMLDAIAKRALDPSIPVTVSSYGGGGSAHSSLKPGQMTDVRSVLNLRNHIDLEPQVDFLLTTLQGQTSIGPDTESVKLAIDKLANIKEKMLRHDRDLSQNIVQNDLIQIRRQLISQGVSAALLKVPDTLEKKFYCEIAITDPQMGKEVFYRTQSYPNRAEAEEIGHLVLLKLCKTKMPNLTQGYIKMLKDTRPEYKALTDKLDPGNKVEQTFRRLEKAMLKQAELISIKERLQKESTDLIRKSIKEQMRFNNDLSTSDDTIPKEDPAKKNSLERKRLEAEIRSISEEQEAIENEILSIEVASQDVMVDSEVKDAIEAYHAREIVALLEKGDQGYWGGLDTQSGNLKHLSTYLKGTYAASPHNPLFEQTREHLRESLMVGAANGFSHNYSSSMFVGAQTKRALAEFTMQVTGAQKTEVIADTNMEDDIVADVIHMLVSGKIGKMQDKSMYMSQFAMARVHCDPFTFSHSVEEKFKEWCKAKTCKKEYYTSAILWGLHGFDTTKLDANAKWDFPDRVKMDLRGEKFDHLFYEENGVVVDPFWREIATDFLADVIKGDAFNFPHDRVGKPANFKKVQMCQNIAVDLKALTRHYLSEKSAGKLTSSQAADFEKEIKTKTEMLVFHVLHANNMINQDSSYKVWARAGSWIGNVERSIDAIAFDGARIDRALYVSSNMSALTSYGKKIVAGELATQQLNDRAIEAFSETTQVPSIFAAGETKITDVHLERVKVISDPGLRAQAAYQLIAFVKTSIKNVSPEQAVALKNLMKECRDVIVEAQQASVTPASRSDQNSVTSSTVSTLTTASAISSTGSAVSAAGSAISSTGSSSAASGPNIPPPPEKTGGRVAPITSGLESSKALSKSQQNIDSDNPPPNLESGAKLPSAKTGPKK